MKKEREKMEITKENAVSVKNMYFCVTVFFVQLVLMLVVFVGMTMVKKFLFADFPTEKLYFVITPIELGLNILIWYIAGKIGIYNLFNSKKIAKKNLVPLRKAVIKDWCFFIGMMILVSLSNILNIIIAGTAVMINLPLLKRNFDKQAIIHYGKVNFG